MYLVDRPEPSKQLIQARELAGRTIETMMRDKSPQGKSSQKGFRWIKTDWTYPSFEHFTFAYRNQVFPVFVELFEEGQSIMQDNECERFIDAASKYNLIPCTFRVEIQYTKKTSWFFWQESPKDNTHFSLHPISSGWNLWDLRTGKPVDPSVMGDDTNIEMSEWEKLDFCVQIVKDYLKKENYKFSSYCSLPEMNPQLWFEDNNGYYCWCIVRHITNIENDDFHKWVGFEKQMPQLKKYDGFYAGVSLASAEPVLYDKAGRLIPLSERYTGKAPLYRGDGMSVRFLGLKRIYVAP